MAVITAFSQLDPQGTYTYADYLTWKFPERVELIQGRIYPMSPPPSRKYRDIAFRLSGLYYQHYGLLENPFRAYTSPFVVLLPEPQNAMGKDSPTVVQPDFCVVGDPSKLEGRSCLGAPDLVVEIFTPGNTQILVREKFRIYQASGVKEYWMIDTRYEVVHCFVLRGTVFEGLAPALSPDVLTTPRFPGWEIPLEELFAESPFTG